MTAGNKFWHSGGKFGHLAMAGRGLRSFGNYQSPSCLAGLVVGAA